MGAAASTSVDGHKKLSSSKGGGRQHFIVGQSVYSWFTLDLVAACHERVLQAIAANKQQNVTSYRAAAAAEAKRLHIPITDPSGASLITRKQFMSVSPCCVYTVVAAYAHFVVVVWCVRCLDTTETYSQSTLASR